MDVGQCMGHAAQDSPRNQQPKRKHVLKQKLVSLTQVLLAKGWWMLVIEAFTHTHTCNMQIERVCIDIYIYIHIYIYIYTYTCNYTQTHTHIYIYILYNQ